MSLRGERELMQICFEPRAQKSFLTLTKTAQTQILQYTKRLENLPNPREFGAALRGNLRGFWRYRVGDYRLICSIHDSTQTIRVVAINHRSRIYD